MWKNRLLAKINIATYKLLLQRFSLFFFFKYLEVRVRSIVKLARFRQWQPFKMCFIYEHRVVNFEITAVLFLAFWLRTKETDVLSYNCRNRNLQVHERDQKMFVTAHLHTLSLSKITALLLDVVLNNTGGAKKDKTLQSLLNYKKSDIKWHF